jgi:hypothetical protein
MPTSERHRLEMIDISSHVSSTHSAMVPSSDVSLLAVVQHTWQALVHTWPLHIQSTVAVIQGSVAPCSSQL